MNSDNGYDTLYDITLEAPPNTLWLAISAVVLVIALLLLWRRRRRGQGAGMPGFMALAFGLLLGVTGLSHWDHQRLQQAVREGRTQVAEGLLQSYSVQHRAHYNSSSKRYDRSIAESFYVGTVPFGFVRDGSVAGYTNSGDAPLRFEQGEVLRVHYVEDAPDDFASRRILRLERLRGPGVWMATSASPGARP
ncbi:MAG: hypothetical protein QM722_05100 [Piscinibacter sp.]